jgi:Permuted papain-like amidase enzyme, YaeF/YiiX, C92 family
MAYLDHGLDRLGGWLARRLDTPTPHELSYVPNDMRVISATLQPGDVILVDGRSMVATAIKYLTQSTWSHAAIWVGDALGGDHMNPDAHCLVESNLGEGCVSAPLSKYHHVSMRICRPSGLSAEDRAAVVAHVIARIGIKYDTRNVLDLARYLFPTPPVPVRWRRSMIALGSGEPTRAICSTLIAQAFESVRYPILPRIEQVMRQDCTDCPTTTAEILHIRHHSLYTPRDFDISPFFDVIKPGVSDGFNYRRYEWADLCALPGKEPTKSTHVNGTAVTPS